MSDWSIKSTGRGWRVSVTLPDDVRRLTRKRVHSVIVRGRAKEATQVAKQIAAEYYPSAYKSPAYFRKCGGCLREFATMKDFKGHYTNLSGECADCRDLRTKGRQSIGARLRFAVLQRDNFTCQYCGRSAPSVVLHVDHKTPVSKGGTNEAFNLITACADCNLGKSDVAA